MKWNQGEYFVSIGCPGVLRIESLPAGPFSPFRVTWFKHVNEDQFTASTEHWCNENDMQKISAYTFDAFFVGRTGVNISDDAALYPLHYTTTGTMQTNNVPRLKVGDIAKQIGGNEDYIVILAIERLPVSGEEKYRFVRFFPDWRSVAPGRDFRAQEGIGYADKKTVVVPKDEFMKWITSRRGVDAAAEKLLQQALDVIYEDSRAGPKKDSEQIIGSITQDSSMSLIKKFKLLSKREPEKTFIKAGVMTEEETLTPEGLTLFTAFLLDKHKDEFKKEVVDVLVEEEKEKS